jgi:hypothetical protein
MMAALDGISARIQISYATAAGKAWPNAAASKLAAGWFATAL